MKLNLGCHDRPKQGYINIDRDLYNGVDVVSDVSKLNYPDSSCSEIYSSNILEHFSHTKTLDVLSEWYRLLRVGGVLKISVPDFDRAIEIYQQCGMADWVVNFLWGDQGYEGANHYCGFNEARLTKLLKQVGFSEVCRVETLPGCNALECSNNRSNMDGKLVSLNMVAIR